MPNSPALNANIMEKRDFKDLFTKNDPATGTLIYYEDEELQNPFNGMFYDFSPEGLVEWEAEVKNGKIHGIEKHYYPSGKLEQINQMKDNTMCGISKEYDESGRITSESIVIRNLYVKSISYNEHGEIVERDDMPYEKMSSSLKKQIVDYSDLRIGEGEGINL